MMARSVRLVTVTHPAASGEFCTAALIASVFVTRRAEVVL